MNQPTNITDEREYTCGACAVPMCDEDAVDVIDLHTHEADLICTECSEHQWITDDYQIIPEHAFVYSPHTLVSIQDSVNVVDIRTEWDSVSDVVHGGEHGTIEDAEANMEQELFE
tara:strand:+ start:506 stop:850 length:345 start_codon:yes stop_codon:yes gene_type:complete